MKRPTSTDIAEMEAFKTDNSCICQCHSKPVSSIRPEICGNCGEEEGYNENIRN